MRSSAKKCLESRMLGNLHVRFGVGVEVQSLGLHHVKVEPRSKNAIAAGNSSFEAGKGKTKEGPKKMRAKDRPLANDFVSDEEFDRLLKAWFSNIARVLEPGRCFYIWGGFSNIANYPPVLSACGLYFSQAIIWDKMHPVMTRKDFMGGSRMGVLWLARGCWPQVLRTEQCHRPVAR